MVLKLHRRRTVCLGDMHCPQHDPRAVRWALDVVNNIKPQRVVLLGDVVDFLAVSRFPKSAEQKLGLQKELEAARKFINTLRKRLRRREVVFLIGNHCVRMQKYLYKQAPELAGIPELATPRLIGVPESWKIVPYNHPHWEQGVMTIHGTRWSRNACNAYLNDYGCSVVAGHSHRANMVNRKLPNGKVITAVESGCLCDLKQNYSAITNWVHAVTLIHGGRVELIRRQQ